MKTFCMILTTLVLSMAAFAQSTVTGVIPQYAGGLVTATTGATSNNAPIDAQGNFTIPVPSNPTSHVMTFTPVGNTPYEPFSLTITAGVGTTNITAQIQAVVPQIGVQLGLSSQSGIATNAQGYAIPGSAGGGLSGVVGTTPIVAVTTEGVATVSCPSCGSGGATIAHTPLVIKGDNAGNGIAAVPGGDYSNSQTSLSGITGNPFQQVELNIIGLNQFNYTTGLPGLNGFTGRCAAPSYCALAGAGTFEQYAADTYFAIKGCTSCFTDAEKLDMIAHFMAQQQSGGIIPETIKQDGTIGQICSALDERCKYGTGDAAIVLPLILAEVVDPAQRTTAYTSYVAGFKRAFAIMPRNGTTHLITVTPGDEWIACIGFEEYMRKTGDDACANVFYAQDAKVLASMATAAGDSTNATFFTNEYNTIIANLPSLIDGSTGLLLAGSIQDNQPDVVATSFAVYWEELSSGQESTISTYFSTNLSTLLASSASGAIQTVLPASTGWSVLGTIPSGGGPPYDPLPVDTWTATNYQGGAWTYFMGEFAYALGKTNLNAIKTVEQSFYSAPDPGTEWYDALTHVAGGNGPLLAASGGASLAYSMYPMTLSAPISQVCVNRYGVCWGDAPNVMQIGNCANVNPGGTYQTIDFNSASQWQFSAACADGYAQLASNFYIYNSVLNDALFLIDHATGNIGIGTGKLALPGYKLAVGLNSPWHVDSVGNMKTAVYTVATLPSASSLPAGTQATVSDGLAITATNPCSGGGSTYQIAITNGSSWSCH